MSRICYVNGELVAEEQARVSIFDRGFLFGDGVYEVSSVLGGALVDNPAHLARLRRSLGEIAMPAPAEPAEIEAIQRELIERNRLEEGTVYLEVTRGAADRSFSYPAGASPSLVMFTQARALVDCPQAGDGIRVITVPEIRWGRRDIKTVCLLPASMAKEAATAAGADDAWMVEDDQVTEGSSSNAWIVTREGVVVTRQLGNQILPGITRAAILRLAGEEGIAVEERPFTPAEACAAAEAFVTSASTFVWPVVAIDGQPIGAGRPGRLTRRLREIYLETARARAAG